VCVCVCVCVAILGTQPPGGQYCLSTDLRGVERSLAGIWKAVLHTAD
jgi:hypothetical protein